jgi:hypothetical protein
MPADLSRFAVKKCGANCDEFPAQGSFANFTPDFIALRIWSKMRSSAFCSIAPEHQFSFDKLQIH